MPVIACLGWGSLVWRREKLQVELPWQEDGPRVQVEFLRQSKSNRITLVLDASAALVPAMWARMKLTDLDEAAENLRIREETSAQNIGRWSAGDPAPELIEDLPAWAETNGVGAVVWTALGRSFHGSDAEPAPVADIITHLGKLPETERKVAEEYVRYAPPQVNTAYRQEIADKLGWTAQPSPPMEESQMEKKAADTTEAGAAAENDNGSAAITSMPDFIADVLKNAREQDGADEALLDILEKHIVRAQPSSLPVDDALSEIDTLAESRATKGEADGEPDHD